ncbi:MAG: hypothetical protein GY870_08570, partial [archaeon]|nr:hypothetical protein [archaeon]
MENSILKDFLDPEEIPFMNYGIINKYNFKEIDNVPIKRWDPLSASFIHLYQSTMSNPVIISKKFGQYSYISPVRSNRPFERKKKLEAQENSQYNEDDSHNLDILMDLFDPMLKGKHYKINEQKYLPAYSIIIADGNKKLDNPFSDRIKIYPNLQGKAVSMINKFPAMVRVIDPDIYPEITRSLLKIDKKSQIARGVCFLTIPRFYHETVEDMTSEELRDLFISMTTSINYIIEESISQKDSSIIPISPFFNVGASVGGSLRRLHCQIYMDLSQDGHGSRMESFLKTFEKMNERKQCQICDSKHGDGSRIIFDTEDWVIFSSGSPIRNYHLRFAPKEHIEDLS